jgi:release factor glutamine methyltransferase
MPDDWTSNSATPHLSPLFLRGRVHSIAGQELYQWQKQARQRAIAADVPTREVDWLLTRLTELDRLALRLGSYAQPHAAASSVAAAVTLAELDQLWQQRLDQRVPLQYLVGGTTWREFELVVAPSVLIPRPETEEIIDLAVQARSQTDDAGTTDVQDIQHWADLGTGSGAIALGLAAAMPDVQVHAVDCSADALAIAQLNARRYRLTSRIQFYQGSWLTPLASLRGRLRGIVSNPPYIPSQTVTRLEPEVQRHEPQLALDGGADGLDCIRTLIQLAPAYLEPGGVLLFEMMAGQAEAVQSLLQQQRYEQIQIVADLSGIERFAVAYRSSTA